MQYNRNPLYTSMRNALATGAVASMALSGQAFAQDEPVELERVETTGSRLSQVDIEGAQPVTVLDRDDIERIGLNDLGDVIRQLPSITGSPLSTRTNNGGNGGSFVDIRGMGPARTLVVINGKRDITDGDFSLIPIAAVERIEVLKEGAAAIYGADAVAGVVNVITRQDFSGAQLQAQYGASLETKDNPGAATVRNPRANGTDGDTKRVSFVFGDTTDKSSFLIGVEYNEQDPVFQGNIDSPQFRFTLDAPANNQAARQFLLDGGGRGIFPCLAAGECTDNNGSSAALGGRFLFIPDGSGIPANNGPFADLTRDLDTGELRPFTGNDQYNYAPVNFIQTPFERTNLFVQGSYDLFDNVEAYVEARYSNRRSEQFLAPVPFFLGFGDPGFVFPDGGQGVSADNVFNPFGIDLNTADNLFFIGRRVAESSRTFEQTINNIQINSGLRGDFGDFAPTWTWDISWNWGRSDAVGQDFGQFSGARVNQALGPSFFDEAGNAVCGTPDAPIDGGCVPLNLFGGFGTITQEMLDFIEVGLNDVLITKLQVANASFSGDLIDLPAGPLSAAFGYEFRQESLDSTPDSGKAANAVTGNTFGPTGGEFDVNSLFAEVNVPLLSGIPGAELLEVGAGFRYDDFSTVGGTGNFMFTLRWQPIQGVLVRGSYSEVFREPTIGNIFNPEGDSFPSFQDVCSNGSINGGADLFALLSAEAQQRCIDQGVAEGGFFQNNAQPRLRIGGNPDIQPENGETWTVGVAWSPEFIPGFSFTADWWDIDLDDAITTFGGADVVGGCVILGVGCENVERDQLSGELDRAISLTSNSGGETASGLDLAFNYNTNTAIGLFDTRLLVSWLESRKTFGLIAVDPSTVVDSLEGSGFFNDVGGFTEGVFPEWKAQWTVDWSFGNFGASVNVEWLDSTVERDAFGDSGFFSGAGDVGVESETYLDLTVRYNLPWGTQVSGGITNLLDNDPPFILSGFNANTDADTFRMLGRSWFARLTHNF